MEITYFNDATKIVLDDSTTTVTEGFPYGHWGHPVYGSVDMNEEIADEMISNFVNNAFGQELSVNFAHGTDPAKGKKAAGTIHSIIKTDRGLSLKLEFTNEAANEIRDKQWKYLSPEYMDEYINPATGETHKNVFVGVALTNNPHLKGIAPLNFQEVPDWGAAEPGTITNPDSPPDPVIPEKQAPQIKIGFSPTFNYEADNVVNNMTEVHFYSHGKWEPVDSANIEFFNAEGEVKNMDEAKLRELLGIDAETSIEDTIKQLSETAGKVKDLESAVDETKKFEEMFPGQAERTRKLEERVLQADAKEFSESFVNAEKKTTFAPAVVEMLNETYPALNATGRSKLKDVLEQVLQGGIVTLGEVGSTGTPKDADEMANPKEALAGKIKQLMDNDNMDHETALRTLSETEPDLVNAYLTSAPIAISRHDGGGE